MDVIKVLKKERDQLASKIKGIDAAIAALGGRWGKVGHKMSAAARAKISATQKKNWAKKRGKKEWLLPLKCPRFRWRYEFYMNKFRRQSLVVSNRVFEPPE
jgi:hypothetical protein